MKIYSLPICWVFAFLFSFCLPSKTCFAFSDPPGENKATLTVSNPKIKQYVMGPLGPPTDLALFDQQMAVLKNRLGVRGITTDLIWSLVEPEPGKYNWQPYLEVAKILRKYDLKWTVIFSFHAIGGNVGDNYTSQLPDHVHQLGSDLFYKDRRGHVNNEYIYPGVEEAYDRYEKVMRSFVENFSEFRDIIEKVYAGPGPAGELRHPSYAFINGWRYPQIGEIPLHSERSRSDWREFLRIRYMNDVENLNKAWNLHFVSFLDKTILPPMDGDLFFKDGVKSQYGKDFLDFQQFILEEHAFQMFFHTKKVFEPYLPLSQQERSRLSELEQQLQNLHPMIRHQIVSSDRIKSRPHFPKESVATIAPLYWEWRLLRERLIMEQKGELAKNLHHQRFLNNESTIGGKLAGIHWRKTDPVYPRAAERAAGYSDYEALLAVFKEMDVSLTFTCMEMEHADSGYPAYSNPGELVGEIFGVAKRYGISVYGENALSIEGNLRALGRVREVFHKYDIRGFTFLRMDNLVDHNAHLTPTAHAYSSIVVQRESTLFKVKMNLSESELGDHGLEFRLVGDVPALGNRNPGKALRLRHQGDPSRNRTGISSSDQYWYGEVLLEEHSKYTELSVVLYDPSKDSVIHKLPLEAIYDQTHATTRVVEMNASLDGFNFEPFFKIYTGGKIPEAKKPCDPNVFLE